MTLFLMTVSFGIVPEGFQPVGKTVFDEHDLVPTSELGCNRLPGQQVLADPEEPDILLLRNYSFLFDSRTRRSKHLNLYLEKWRQ